MMAGILQSSYLPWLGVLDMLDRVDVFVWHNDLQYDRSWRNRNRIRVGYGRGWRWLTVPVRLGDGTATLLNQARIDYGQKWNRKHWSQVYENYHSAPHFEAYAEAFREILLSDRWERLVDLNAALITAALRQLGIERRILQSEDLELGDSRKNERVVRICQQVGADTWLANSACRDYVEPEVYEAAGIRVVFQDYKHPSYPQQFEPFVSHMSILDLLLNCGPDSLAIIRSTRDTCPGC